MIKCNFDLYIYLCSAFCPHYDTAMCKSCDITHANFIKCNIIAIQPSTISCRLPVNCTQTDVTPSTIIPTTPIPPDQQDCFCLPYIILLLLSILVIFALLSTIVVKAYYFKNNSSHQIQQNN